MKQGCSNPLFSCPTPQVTERIVGEPRIEVISVEVDRNEKFDGALVAEIQYEIKATHDTRSIVYPFYIEAEEEIV